MKNLFGVPCSRLKDKIEDVEVNCTSEEEAMALAAGAWLAGKEATVYMQNSGLCRCLDIILSLYKPYNIPLPKLILSVRHQPHHHYFVGKVTPQLLEMVDYQNVEIIEEGIMGTEQGPKFQSIGDHRTQTTAAINRQIEQIRKEGLDQRDAEWVRLKVIDEKD